ALVLVGVMSTGGVGSVVQGPPMSMLVIFTLLFTNVVGTNTVQITAIDLGGPWTTLPTPEATVTPTGTSATFTLLRPDNNAALLGVKVTYLLNGQSFTATVDIKN
ncbi:MAG TPA: hypothetical protein VFM86_01460, partial [Pedococcus sp.]|nr:hypothetical protein [Pedococcus sp.]